MKKGIFIVFWIIACYRLHAQSTPEERSASHIAQIMKDSLSLTEAQTQQLYSISLPIHQQKQQLRQQYAGKDTLGFLMKKLELKRDSLYKIVLPAEKYQLYQQKRVWLNSSN